MLTIIASPRIKQKDKIYRIPVSNISEDKHIKQPVGFLQVKGALELLADTGNYSNVTPTTVVLDDLSSTADYALDYALFLSGHLGQQPTQPDWGKQIRELQDLIELGISLPCNFICIAHERILEDKLTGRVWCLPLITGQFVYKIGGFFDEVYHSKVMQNATGKEVYKLETKPSGIITAKSRLDLPAVIDTHFSSISGTIEKLNDSARKAQIQNIQP